MKKTLTLLLLMMTTLLASAQTLTEGYYRIEVPRSGGVVYSENRLIWQDLYYTAPTQYTAADLKYIFKFEELGEGFFKIQNCKSKEYISLPSTNGHFSVQLPTSSNGAIFSYEETEDGRYYGFYTYAKFVYGEKEYEQIGYLNDFNMGSARSLCLWTDGPTYDNGSKFTVVSVDASIVETLMNGGTVDPNPDPDPNPTTLVSFVPESGVTYTLFSRNTSGYAAGNGDVKKTVTEACEYSFENSGIKDDNNLPTYYIKQVSTGKYLQKVDLSNGDDSSDLQLGLPHGNQSNAARFTVVKAQNTGDYRAACKTFVDGDYVICCVDGYWHTSGEYRHYYVESFSNAMFYAPYDDGSARAFRIERYVPGTVTPPSVEEPVGDDQSVELWGAATDTIAVQQNGYVLLIPNNMIERTDYTTDGKATPIIILKGEQESYSGKIVATPHIGADFPKFRTFKFNNKYNDVLMADVEASEITDKTIAIDVTGCIGKTLCPSFSLTEESANVYYRGVRQISHQNRNRFDRPLTYTIAKPGYKILQVVKTKDEVWSNPNGGEVTDGERIILTADQLSTNAPSGRGQGPDKMLDGNPNTFFHSTWTNDPYYEPLNWDAYNPENTEWPYIDIKLNTPLRKIKWGYMSSPNENRYATGIKLLAGNDGETWTEVADFGEDVLPAGTQQQFVSPAIDMGRNYSYLRVLLTSASYKNYIVMSEMFLYKVVESTGGNEPELLEPAEYQFSERPWGRDVVVNTTFATDRATNVPRIDINLNDGVSLSYIHSNKTTYYPGTLSIDGAGVFPDMEPTEVNMRGRGNSSWSASKKPYRLKFNAKQKPFGLKKGKSWCLIAQAQTGSMLTNPIALRVATMTGTMGANHAIPVELYVNDSYIGSYMFTENPGFGNNSVDIDETNACLLELDSYYDEAYKFRDNYYYLPVNIKEPDLTELTDYYQISDIKNTIQNHFNDFTHAVSNRQADKYEAMTDIDSWSRFMLVNDVVRNTELMHPKSTKLFRVDITNEDDPYVWGPVWDFDWAFGYQNSHSYYVNQTETDLYEAIIYNNTGGSQGYFFYDMLNNSEVMKSDRYRVWTEFMNVYRDELLDYVDDYHNFAKPSFLNNSYKWSDGRDYTQNAENAKSWLKARTDWVYNNMPVYDLPAVTYGLGDVNEDGRISVGDAICIVNHILGLPNDFFSLANADMNGDGSITVGDLQLVIRAILDAENTAASARAQMPRCEATLTVMPFTTTAHAEAEVQVNLTTEELTAGLQMDVVLPMGAILTNVRTADALSPFNTRISDLGGGRYRVLLVAADGARIEASDMNNMLLDITMGDIPATKDGRTVRINNITLASPEGTDLAVSPARALFAEATGVDTISADEILVRGGDDLTIQSVKDGDIDVFNLAGQLVRRIHVTRGTTVVNLPLGVYIVNGYKVMVD